MEIKQEAEALSFGRLGAIYDNGQCLIETNLDLSIGNNVDISSSLFEELGIKKPVLKILNKNHVGRYYQYTHSYLCKVIFEDESQHLSTYQQWIKENIKITKSKSIKVVFFENHPHFRENLRLKIKNDSKYCARGYKNLLDIQDVLDYQLPRFILDNRELVDQDPGSFIKIRDFLKRHQAFVITYNESGKENEEKIEKYKKDFSFALHAPGTLELTTLESMVQKFIDSQPTEQAIS